MKDFWNVDVLAFLVSLHIPLHPPPLTSPHTTPSARTLRQRLYCNLNNLVFHLPNMVFCPVLRIRVMRTVHGCPLVPFINICLPFFFIVVLIILIRLSTCLFTTSLYCFYCVILLLHVYQTSSFHYLVFSTCYHYWAWTCTVSYICFSFSNICFSIYIFLCSFIATYSSSSLLHTFLLPGSLHYLL